MSLLTLKRYMDLFANQSIGTSDDDFRVMLTDKIENAISVSFSSGFI